MTVLSSIFKNVQTLSFKMMKIPIHAPKMFFWGGKRKGNFFCCFIPLGMLYPGTEAVRIKPHKNRLCCFGSRREQNFGPQKIKNHARVIFRPFAQTPPLGRWLSFLACRVLSPNFVSIVSGVSEF